MKVKNQPPRGYRYKQVYRPYSNTFTGASTASANTVSYIGGWVTVKVPTLSKRWELWVRACPLWSK